MTEASSGNVGHEAGIPSVGGQLVIPVLSIIFSLYYFSTILDSPWTAQVSAFLIGGILVALSVLFILRTVLAARRGEASLRMKDLFPGADISSGRLGLFGVTIGYIVLIEWGGFTLTTFLFLFISMVILNGGQRKRMAALIASMMALGGYGLFILAFDTRFPRGPFETFMEAVLNRGG